MSQSAWTLSGPYDLIVGGSADNPTGDQPTVLLGRAASGDQDAVQQLFPIVYDELRARAGAYFRGQPQDLTIQPTALVHEVYVKLIRSSSADWDSKSHFIAIASRAMRQILIDHARRRDKERRAVEEHTPRTLIHAGDLSRPQLDVLALDEVLIKLESLDTLKARIVELRFFGGLEIARVADVVGISESTVIRQWRLIKAWLSKELSERPVN